MIKETDPQMHTAEHLLNQTMVRMFGCDRCFSAHINRKKSKCDYRFDRPLEEGELREIERRVNAVIAEDLPVTAEMMERGAAERLFNLGRVPEGDAALRIVRIGDYDACPCIGRHVDTTAEIGQLRIVSASFEEGVLRIRFKLNRKS